MLIDISHYQGVVNWNQADPAIGGAYIKTTEGSSAIDDQWAANHSGTTGYGKPAGAYHFADLGNPVAEANHFADIYLQATWQLHPVLDIESNGATANWITQFRNQFRSRVGTQHFRVYSSLSLLQGALNPSNWIDANTTIWVAAYRSTLGWNHPQAVLWQNTSSATIPGILGSVDDDQYLNGWTPAADGAVSGTTTTTTKEVDMPSFGRVCSAGKNEHADMSVAGCTVLGIDCSYGQTVKVYDLLFWGDTPGAPAPAASGVGGGYASENHGGATWTVDSNRGGPIQIPAGARSLTLRYDADHDFYLSAGTN